MKSNLKKGLSVVIPARGNCEFLSDAVDSIYTSNRIPDEVIIVDDGINARALDLVKKRFSSLVVVTNSGQGLVDGLNTGLAMSSYDLIARLDADDMVGKARFEEQERFMRENLEVVLCGSQISFINTSGSQVGKSNYLTGDITEETRKGIRCLLAHPSVIFRTEAVREVGRYRKLFSVSGTNFSEDFDLWIRLSRIGRIVNLNQELTFYRQHSEQLSVVHREPQELSNYYVQAACKFEDSSTESAPDVIISTYKEGLKLSSFIFQNLGLRKTLKFNLELMTLFGLFPRSLKRILLRF